MTLRRVIIAFGILTSLVVILFGINAHPVISSVSTLPSSTTQPPILLIVNSSNSANFGAYLGEILRAEGLNAFDQVELSSVTATQLAQYDLAILAQTALNSAQASMFNTYVSGGGALLAMRPDQKINGLFGLNATAGTLTNGYLQIQNNANFNNATPGSGLISATLQIHGGADQYTLAPGAVMLAQLYITATTSTPYAAVVGAPGGGQAVAFTYNLPMNVAYTRQGNPANVNLDVDGDSYTRTVDLFQTVGNTQTAWVDRNKIPIPQADEQQRLLARLVTQLVGRNRPLPQLWYFPGTAKTMFILTSDAHWNNGLIDYSQFFTDLNTHQGQATMYLSSEASVQWPDNASLQTWEAQGNTFGIHPYRLITSTLAAGFNAVDSLFSTKYTVPRSNTVRIHRYEWQGWTDAADIEAAHNIALDISFAVWGKWLQKPDGTWPHGYITGSGLPMKFVRTDGTLTSVYQQLLNLSDDQLLPAQDGPEGLTASQAVSVSQSLLDASLAGNYSAQTELHHVDFYSTTLSLQQWLTGDVDYARSKGVPIWNADQWLSFTQARHDANFSNIVWDASSGVLSFTIAMTATPGLTPTTILPLNYASKPLAAVTLDGGTYTFTVQTIKSTAVAFVSIPAGNHSVAAKYSTGKLSQTITFTPLTPKTYGDPPFTVTATATSGLPVTFTVSGAACSISGITVTLMSAGQCPVTAHQSGNAAYDPALDVTRALTITKRPASVSAVGNSKTYGNSDPALATTNNNFLAGDLGVGKITFSATRAPGESVAASPYVITPTASDSSTGLLNNYTVTFNTALFTITKATPVITWNNPANIVYGTALTVTQLNAQASVPGNFVYTPPAGTVLNAGVGQTLHAGFTPNDTSNYAITAKDVTITVTKATPTLVVTGGTFAYDGQPHAASGFAYGIGGSSDVLSPGLTFTYNGSGSVPVALGRYIVVGSFAGNSNYVPATKTAVLTIAYIIYLPLVTRNGS